LAGNHNSLLTTPLEITDHSNASMRLEQLGAGNAPDEILQPSMAPCAASDRA
jgi:hypothetical protein